MNTLRFLLLLSGLFLSRSVEAQWRLLYQSQDIIAMPSDTLPQISLIESRGALSKYLIVHFSDGKKTLVLKKSVWGYIDGNNRTWRSYDKDVYLVTKYNGGWVEYMVNRIGINGQSGSPYNTFQRVYSRTLDGRISPDWSNAMSDVPPSYIVR